MNFRKFKSKEMLRVGATGKGDSFPDEHTLAGDDRER